MQLAFGIIAGITLLSAVGAMYLRNLVYCVLCLVVTFGGLAAFFLQLNAQFIGFAQILVYIGAVAVLMVFALLLTRNAESAQQAAFSKSWWMGGVAATLVFFTMALAILRTPKMHQLKEPSARITTREIGNDLMTKYVLPLEAIGLLLTAAMIGAVVIAMPESVVRQAGERDAEAKKTPSGGRAVGRHLEPSITDS